MYLSTCFLLRGLVRALDVEGVIRGMDGDSEDDLYSVAGMLSVSGLSWVVLVAGIDLDVGLGFVGFLSLEDLEDFGMGDVDSSTSA